MEFAKTGWAGGITNLACGRTWEGKLFFQHPGTDCLNSGLGQQQIVKIETLMDQLMCLRKCPGAGSHLEMDRKRFGWVQNKLQFKLQKLQGQMSKVDGQA